MKALILQVSDEELARRRLTGIIRVPSFMHEVESERARAAN